MKRNASTYDLSHFSKILKPVTKKALSKHSSVMIDLISGWKSIVGDEVGSYSLPQSLKHKNKQKNNATLIVAVKSSAFGLEISGRKSLIIQKVNTYFGYNLICDVNTIVADIVCGKINDEEINVVSNEENLYIKEKTTDIKSDELKSVLERLGASIIRREQK